VHLRRGAGIPPCPNTSSTRVSSRDHTGPWQAEKQRSAEHVTTAHRRLDRPVDRSAFGERTLGRLGLSVIPSCRSACDTAVEWRADCRYPVPRDLMRDLNDGRCNSAKSGDLEGDRRRRDVVHGHHRGRRMTKASKGAERIGIGVRNAAAGCWLLIQLVLAQARLLKALRLAAASYARAL